jgi:hypothetical protein
VALGPRGLDYEEQVQECECFLGFVIVIGNVKILATLWRQLISLLAFTALLLQVKLESEPRVKMHYVRSKRRGWHRGSNN